MTVRWSVRLLLVMLKLMQELMHAWLWEVQIYAPAISHKMLVGQAKRPHYHHASHQAKLQYAKPFLEKCQLCHWSPWKKRRELHQAVPTLLLRWALTLEECLPLAWGLDGVDPFGINPFSSMSNPHYSMKAILTPRIISVWFKYHPVNINKWQEYGYASKYIPALT